MNKHDKQIIEAIEANQPLYYVYNYFTFEIEKQVAKFYKWHSWGTNPNTQNDLFITFRKNYVETHSSQVFLTDDGAKRFVMSQLKDEIKACKRSIVWQKACIIKLKERINELKNS